MARLRSISLFAILTLGACTPTLPPPELGPPLPAAYETEQSRLLLFPEADAESLLGRAVQHTRDGAWTIADARAPGCEVSVRHVKATYRTSRTVNAHSMTSIAGGYAKVVSIEARFGRKNAATIEIDNTEVLHADTRGGCGEMVVSKVFVGHGKRSIEADADAGGKAGINAGVVTASPTVDTGQSQEDAISWTDDQAYGFEVKVNAKVDPLDLRVSMPSVLHDGDDVTVRFDADRPAWLVVYYIDANNHADVLWPSNEEPAPSVTPKTPAVLPSPKERAAGFAIKAATLRPGIASRETLVVYAFADRADFDALKPSAGGESADGPAYAATLTQKLQSIPMNRWSRAVAGYEIEPKK